MNEVIKHIKYLISNNLREWAEKFATILSCNVKSRAQWVSLQQNIVVFRSEHKVSEKLIAKSILINPNQIDLRIDDNSKNDNAWDDLCEAVAGSCWSHIDNYIGRPLGTIVGGGDDVAMTIEIRKEKERNKKQEIKNKKYKKDTMMWRWPTIFFGYLSPPTLGRRLSKKRSLRSDSLVQKMMSSAGGAKSHQNNLCCANFANLPSYQEKQWLGW